jgi:hypothetical protein
LHDAEQEAIRQIVAFRAQGKPLRANAEAVAHKLSHEGVAVERSPRGIVYTEIDKISRKSDIHRLPATGRAKACSKRCLRS